MNMKFAIAAVSALVLSALTDPARAANLVTDGSFTNFTAPPDGSSAFYQTLNNTDLAGWQTTSGYSFVVNASQATGGFNGPDGAVSLYGPIGASPDGGAFLAADGAYETGYSYTTVSGLTVGRSYTLSFYQAAAQQTGYSGSTTDLWTVGFGSTYANSTFVNSALISLPSQTSSGWELQTITLTATASSEVLSFLAQGTPSGEPPFALLDGVTLTQAVPEPSTYALMIVGLLALTAARKWRRGYSRPVTASIQADI